MVKHSSCITKNNTAQFDTRSERFQPPQWAALQAVQLKDCSTTFIYSSWGRKILSSSTLVTRRKTSFSICLPSSKTYYLSYSIKKHDIINMADPSSMQECVSYMNLVMDLAHHRVSVAQW